MKYFLGFIAGINLWATFTSEGLRLEFASLELTVCIAAIAILHKLDKIRPKN